MTYIIAEPCVGVMDTACVDVCPVDCIYRNEPQSEEDRVNQKTNPGTHPVLDAAGNPIKMLVIHPNECIDCGACEPECPVSAIFVESEVPEKWHEYIAFNYRAFGLEP